MKRRACLAAAAVLIAALQLTTAQSESLRVTFLGTGGGPIGRAEYGGPAILVEYGREVILVDAGRSVVQRMLQLNRQVPQIRSIFLTHLHSDHTIDIPDVWLRGWWGEGRKNPLEIRGPAGTKAMAEHIEQAWSYDVRIRSGEPEKIDPAMAKLIGVDVEPGVIFDEAGMKVTALKADHGPVLSLAYRIDAGGHSVVLSGDDRQSPDIIAQSQNVDVLAHSVGLWTPEALADTGAVGKKNRAAIQLLPSAEMAANVFSKAKPRLAVLYHWPHSPKAIDAIRAAGYSGPLEGADDLMEIVIGDSIRVTRPK
jgi:ribonuclease Z